MLKSCPRANVRWEASTDGTFPKYPKIQKKLSHTKAGTRDLKKSENNKLTSFSWIAFHLNQGKLIQFLSDH